MIRRKKLCPSMRLNKSHVFQGPLRNALSNLDLVYLREAQKQFAFLSAKHFLKYFSRIFFLLRISSRILYIQSLTSIVSLPSITHGT